MPSKLLKRDFAPHHYYHLKHQAKKDTFLFQTAADYKNFLLLLSYYLRFPDATPLSWVKRLNPKTVVEKRDQSKLGTTPVTLHGFLLLPDCFHLLLQENLGGDSPGISNLMRRLSVGYAMYYNKTYQTQGTIFLGKYKNYVLETTTLPGTLDTLHHPDGINDTYLLDPTHSSRADYNSNPRPWLSPLPL